ncbi:hypothetical protein EG869_11760, partial [Enterococcus faecium]
SINQCKITKNLSQNVVHSDSDLILHNSSVLIDKEPFFPDPAINKKARNKDPKTFVPSDYVRINVALL